MRRGKIAAAVAALAILAACEGAGEHNDVDESAGTGGETLIDSSATGTSVRGVSPPPGTTNPAPGGVTAADSSVMSAETTGMQAGQPGTDSVSP